MSATLTVRGSVRLEPPAPEGLEATLRIKLVDPGPADSLLTVLATLSLPLPPPSGWPMPFGLEVASPLPPAGLGGLDLIVHVDCVGDGVVRVGDWTTDRSYPLPSEGEARVDVIALRVTP